MGDECWRCGGVGPACDECVSEVAEIIDAHGLCDRLDCCRLKWCADCERVFLPVNINGGTER